MSGGAHRAIRAWLRLLAVSRRIEGELQRRLRARFDTTLPRFDVLAQLERAPDGLSMGALTRRLTVSGGNVTVLVARLLDEGLVAAETDPADRRSQIVRLTAAGRARFAAMLPAHEAWVEELMAGLDAAELDHLIATLDRLRRADRPEPAANAQGEAA